MPENIEEAKRWLIEPKTYFGDKCAVELIIDNRTDEVKKYIEFLRADIYS